MLRRTDGKESSNAKDEEKSKENFYGFSIPPK